nr:hypothetical protein [uncultured Draconibacterium sp.]
MRTKKTLFLTTIFVSFFAVIAIGQNENLDFEVQEKENEYEEDFTIFNMNDFRDALMQLGINVYKWNMPIPKDKDYKLEIYVEEYEHRKLVRDSVLQGGSSMTWGFNDSHRAEYKYLSNIRIISEMPVYPTKVNKINLRITLYPSKFQSIETILTRPEYNTYFIRKFAETDFEISKNIPLLLITAGWEANVEGFICRKFCGPNNPPADLNDDSLHDSDHYFVVGYRVLDEDFYGREVK